MSAVDSSKNILIVDDEPSNLLALEAVLGPLGLQLVRASSGVEALKIALKMDFALVLLDVQMPEMDGFETAEILRKRARTRDVPIIFVTAISKESKFIARGYGVGAVDYLFKPFDVDVLRSKVAVFVELASKNAIIRQQAERLHELSQRELADFKRWSERRYVDLAESMPELVWTADATGTIQYQNGRFRELADGEAGFSKVVHPADLPKLVEGWREAVKKGAPWDDVLRFGTPESGYRFHLVRAVPRRSETDQVVAWIGTSTDIDERVRAERALGTIAEASRRLGAVLEKREALAATIEGLVPAIGDIVRLELVNDDGQRDRFDALRDASLKPILDDPSLGLGPETVIHSGRSLVHFDLATVEGDALRFLHDRDASSYMCLPLPARAKVVGTLTVVRTKTAERLTAADVVLAEDIARRIAVAVENARLQETTERRRLELEEANRSKDVFLATLSHELRTPLNAIIGWLDMMRRGAIEGEELTRALETVDRNAHSLSGLVADLLDVSRIVTGSLKLDSSLVALASVVEAAVETAKPACAAKEVILEPVIDRVGCVRGDAGRLRQVIGNLLSNATKFTPSGGKITIRVDRDDTGGRVTVTDSGEGIEPALLPHVFERFRQAENARSRGLGLGLAIVKHLVEEHGGHVTVASEKGHGASFVVHLPIAAEEGSATDDVRVSTAPSGDPDLKGLHILVVEDDPDGNELITAILERYGARVTPVGTVADALDAIDATPPDVLVSDIGLPDADGMELIRQARTRASMISTPAIALTAYASRQDAAKAIAAGFDAHVAKPVNPSTLGAAVARLVARQKVKPSAA